MHLFFSTQPSLWSNSHISSIWTFVGKVMSLLFNTLSGFVMDFPRGSDGKESAYNTGDLGSTPGLERSPGDGNGNSHQYSCLENSIEREALWVTLHIVHGSQRVRHDCVANMQHSLTGLS